MWKLIAVLCVVFAVIALALGCEERPISPIPSGFPDGVIKFDDVDATCYVYDTPRGSAISCVHHG